MLSSTQTAVIVGTFCTLSGFCYSASIVIYHLLSHLYFVMASDDREVPATRSAHEEGGSTLATSCFVVRETVPHLDVAVYRRLNPNTLDATCFVAMFSDGRNSAMFDRLGICSDTYIGAWNPR